MSIRIAHVSKRFGAFHALRDVDLDIHGGELVALLGPSGCGKTTLLRVIAGLESPDEGQILFHGSDATDVHARERKVGFVFQHYALFRHMTVFDNVAFGLRMKPRTTRLPESVIRQKVTTLLELVQLDWLATRYPAQLSGGQRQRIALARALAVEPQVLLLDEPFGALDAKVRKDLRRWLRRLHDELHVTSVFVTHDQEEALEVADRVVVLDHGAVQQVGTPHDVWEHPANPFVVSFLGDVNLFHGRAHEGELLLDHGLTLASPEHAQAQQASALAYVRPHEVDVLRATSGGDTPLGGIPARLQRALVVGPLARLELQPAHGAPLVEAHIAAIDYRRQGFQVGETLLLRPRNARVFVGAGDGI